jgi:hypothetical protein
VRSGSSALRRLRGVLYFTSLLLTALVAAEATARIEDRLRLDVPLLAEPDRTRDLVLQTDTGIRGKPYGRFKKWRLNAFGFRNGPVALDPPVGCARVVTLGASETFGLYEADGGEYPVQLQHVLQPSGCFEVVNAAIAGLTVRGIRQTWANWIAQFRPAVAVVYPTPGFYLANNPPDYPKPRVPEPPVWWAPRLWDRAHDVISYPDFVQRRRTMAWLSAARSGQPRSWYFEMVPPDRLQRFLDDCEQLGLAVAATGATPIFVTHANGFHQPPSTGEQDALRALNVFSPRAEAHVLLEFETATARELVKMGARHGWTVVDAAATMDGRSEWFAEDLIHFNEAGAAEMARLVARGILTATHAVQ